MHPNSILKYATPEEIAELKAETDERFFRAGFLRLLRECMERVAVEYVEAAKVLVDRYRLLGATASLLESSIGNVWSDANNPRLHIPGSRSLKATKTTENNWESEHLADGHTEVLKLHGEQEMIRTEARELFGRCPL